MAATLANASNLAVTTVESPLLRLPLELRQAIYAFVFGPPRAIDVSNWTELDGGERSTIHRSPSKRPLDNGQSPIGRAGDDSTEDPASDTTNFPSIGSYIYPAYEREAGILEVSKTISDEGLDVLYAQHTFIADLHDNGHREFRRLGAANLRRMRRLRLVARPMGIIYGHELLASDAQLWLPLLGGLVELCIVAQQPSQAQGKYNALTFEEDMREWTAWLEPILQYISANVLKTTVISLDADGGVETTALMGRYFAGYKVVETSTGDLLFKRGEYSLGSGYWDDYIIASCYFPDP